nr:MAG TPA: hypothetical protein [Crassvirales sp.]
MEEQNKAKQINMNAGTGKSETKQQKLTYEQLNDACNQLWQQNKQLAARNRELETFAMNKRLDYLFKVLELSNQFSSDFIRNCASEIEQAMTIPQDIEEHKKED